MCFLEREPEYLNQIVRAPHRPRIGRNRTGAVVLPCELREPVCAYAYIAEPARQAATTTSRGTAASSSTSRALHRRRRA